MFNIEEELKELPQKPGVYLMKDKNQQIIYVGKAINLRNRVRQYFQDSYTKAIRTQAMVGHIKSFEYIVVDNEIEALILENNLIKENKPKYNVLLKDDKTYPYIKISVNEMFPRVYMVRKVSKDGAKYFGPYTNVGDIRNILDLIHSLWKIRRCSKKFPRDLNKERPCLYYHIGQCEAPCNELISEEKYNLYINEAIDLLNGKYDDIIKKLNIEMDLYSKELEFEKAAELRDNINALKNLSKTQRMDLASSGDQDIIAFAREKDEALAQVFFIRGGKMTGREHFILSGVEGKDKEEIMTAFLKQFYSETSYIPKELVLDTDVNDKDTIINWLSIIRGNQVQITIPKIGNKKKLVDLAYKNAGLSLNQFGEQMKREKARTKGALEEIEEALGIDVVLERIEAYDISNIQGYESVGSMVVFEDGKPKRSDYRKFRIKTVIGPDDYASMEEVIYRRFNRYKKEMEEKKETGKSSGKFSTLPDAIFIDGGKGQVNAAINALKKFDLDIIPVVGMIKDDRHRTRGLLYNDEEITMPFTSEGFLLVTRIQDEVHRFAIEYHRKLRKDKQVHSVLDDIEGIGKVRRTALMKHFGSIDKIRTAEITELMEVESMNKLSAENVYNFFRGVNH